MKNVVKIVLVVNESSGSVVKIFLVINELIKWEQRNIYSSSAALGVRIKWNTIIKFSRENCFEPSNSIHRRLNCEGLSKICSDLQRLKKDAHTSFLRKSLKVHSSKTGKIRSGRHDLHEIVELNQAFNEKKF